MKKRIFLIIIISTFTVFTAYFILKNIRTISEHKINEIKTNVINKNESIYINKDVIIPNYDIDGRAKEVNLTEEYTFLNEILEINNAEIKRQIKIYSKEYKGQKRENYSKFQENTIIYKIKNSENNFVEMNFSKNKLLGDCLHILQEEYKTSFIENEEVQIFEYTNPENDRNITGLAFFTLEDINFRIKGYNISHEDFIKIIETTINTYKNT